MSDGLVETPGRKYVNSVTVTQPEAFQTLIKWVQIINA